MVLSGDGWTRDSVSDRTDRWKDGELRQIVSVTHVSLLFGIQEASSLTVLFATEH